MCIQKKYHHCKQEQATNEKKDKLDGGFFTHALKIIISSFFVFLSYSLFCFFFIIFSLLIELLPELPLIPTHPTLCLCWLVFCQLDTASHLS